MDLFLYDNEFHLLRIIDAYESVIWTERFCAYGDFELQMPFNSDLYEVLSINRGILDDYYVAIRDSSVYMIVEEVNILTDSEDGDRLIVKGRSLESILDRRVIWSSVTIPEDTSLQNCLRLMINTNMGSAASEDRRIPGLTFQNSSDIEVTSRVMSGQFFGDNLYDVVSSYCELNYIGFKMEVDSSNHFVFSLYAGKDRSYNQADNSYVVFSPKLDNLISSNYVESNQNTKTVALVAGEGEGADRKFLQKESTFYPNITGLRRRELFVDASSISSNTEEEITQLEYFKLLQSEGDKELVNYQYVETCDGEVDSSMNFIYGRDYSLGDIVEFENEYGKGALVRVTELIRSYDSNGYSEYPTFEKVEQTEPVE